MKRLLIAMALALAPPLSSATDLDAAHCVRLGKLMNAGTVQKFENVCDFEVKMYGCSATHNCGSDPSYHPYFVNHEFIEAGSSTIWRTGPGVEWHLAVCRARDMDGTLRDPRPVMLDGNRSYRCEPQR